MLETALKFLSTAVICVYSSMGLERAGVPDNRTALLALCEVIGEMIIKMKEKAVLCREVVLYMKCAWRSPGGQLQCIHVSET